MPDRAELAQVYVQEASQALTSTIRPARRKAEQTDVLEEMGSRTSIDMAVGMIMAQNRSSHEEAFTTLRAASASRNIKLSDITVGVIGAAGNEPHPYGLRTLSIVRKEARVSLAN